MNIDCPNCGGVAVWNNPEEEAETGFLYMCMDCGWASDRESDDNPAPDEPAHK